MVVMEYASGGTLVTALTQSRSPPPPRFAWMRGVFRAPQHTHVHHVVHQDINKDTMFLRADDHRRGGEHGPRRANLPRPRPREGPCRPPPKWQLLLCPRSRGEMRHPDGRVKREDVVPASCAACRHPFLPARDYT